ncbi:YDG domain-containing protein, partial [Limnohabitans sp.]|uniref:YDG domain-containing protein n=2 Tax=Limnohabitans sp. TaxID=1907725 RepID=UPI00391940EC
QTAGVSAQASITPRPVTLSGNSAADKVADGTTTAQVIAGSLSGLVAGEGLNVNAQGEFEDALVGTNKAVNARFALQNGALGLASNYQLSNPVEVLRASIVAFVPGKVSPEPLASGNTSGSRVRFVGGTVKGAATGVSDEALDPEMVEQCSVLSPEKCECVDTQLPGVALCFVPIRRVSMKD